MSEQSMTERKKKNVLLSFVGNTDPWPYKGAPEDRSMICPDGVDVGAILGLCKGLKPEYHPDILYMFPSCRAKNTDSSRNTEWRAEWIEEILAKQAPDIKCRILPLDITDPTDFEQISMEWARNVDIALDELKVRDNPDEYQFHLNCTSATQQMTAVAYVFASTGRIPGIIRWQCKDPQFVRETGGERIVEVNATFLEENEHRKRMEAGAKHLSFVSVQDSCATLSKIASSPRQRQIAEHLGKIFEAYVFMDALRYQDAYVMVRDVEKSPIFNEFLDDAHSALLKAQVEMLKILQTGSVKESTENLVDLYFNMQRCFTRGAYTDVLARFWRMGEGCVYYRLENEWGIDPRNIMNSPIKENLEAIKRHFDKSNLKDFMEFRRGRTVLMDVFKDKAFNNQELNKIFSKDIMELIERRNHTIIAHGMRPVSEQNAKECIKIAEKLLRAFLPNAAQMIEKYPFREQDIMAWVTLF